jgi:hypothetical protein
MLTVVVVSELIGRE